MKMPYLYSKQRRGRWFHYYRRDGKEHSLDVHGLAPEDPRVLAAWSAAHQHFENNPDPQAPRAKSFAWMVDVYLASRWWSQLAPNTQKSRKAILRKYIAAHGGRPLSTISRDDLRMSLYQRGGHSAVNHFKALKPVFEHAYRLRLIPENPLEGVKVEKPKTKGFPEATGDDLAAFMDHWPIGTTERLTLDLAVLTGAARVDLCRLSRKHVKGDVLEYERSKTGVTAYVPMTPDLRAVLSRCPDISPAFITNKHGWQFSAAGLGNFFGDAAREAGVNFRLHGLRKAFCIYWAELGYSTHEIAAMAGHTSLSEVERYTRAADRKRMIAKIAGAYK